ncbi:MAG: ABC transporter permease [Ruminococcus sp.]|nr:ABC transporter permease [Ruminococcus sp.]
MNVNTLLQLLQSSIAFGTIIMFGAVGEIITEKSGNLNLGIPGVMYMGAIASLIGVFFYEKNVENPIPIVCVIIAILCAFLAAALGGLLFSFLTITLRANQNVTGLTLTIFGSGVANFFGGMLNGFAGGVGQIRVETTSKAFMAKLPFLSDLGIVGKAIFSYGWLVYVAIAIAILAQWYMNKTRSGLNLRAVGENPATADAAGINVTVYRYLATCIGTGIAGLGGLYYVMDYTKGTWANDGTMENLGWLAVALVIFAIWRPKNAIWGAYLFGLLFWVYLYIPGLSRKTLELFNMLPYVVTIIVLIFTSLRKKRENQPPNGLGLAYFREDR